MDINCIYNENCLETMAKMPNDYVDLVVTSPPYDNMRAYNGYSFEFEKIQIELFRVIKDGGTLVWVVADQTENGTESGTSFKQQLYFKEIGFNLFDTMIWHKKVQPFGSIYSYFQTFEYMFVLTKGFPKTANLIADVLNVSQGTVFKRKSRSEDGNEIITYGKKAITRTFRKRENVWDISQTNNGMDGYPQQFPEKLQKDHIITWSNEGDLVYDPFSGSGTVAKMQLLTNRNYIGSEISQDYCKIIENRLKTHIDNKENNLDKFLE